MPGHVSARLGPRAGHVQLRGLAVRVSVRGVAALLGRHLLLLRGAPRQGRHLRGPRGHRSRDCP